MKGKSKKFLSSTTAIICVLAILVSGTLAWQAASSAINAFVGRTTPTDPGANLHDDFDPYERDGDGNIEEDEDGNPVYKSGLVDKNVFVENTGDTTVYVRIQLFEQLNGGGDDYKLYYPIFESGVLKGGQYPGFTWGVGNTAEYDYTSIVDAAKWDTSKDAKAQSDLIADALGGALDGNGTRDAIADLTDLAKDKKAPVAQVISMEEYSGKSDADKGSFIGWIYDYDGYAYWSKPLAAGTATGLLLDSVTVPPAGTREYTYDIRVEMEYVDRNDIGAWLSIGADGERQDKIVDGRWDGTFTGPDGAIIKEGPNVNGTTVEASNAAKALLRFIAEPNKNLTVDGGNMTLVQGETKPAPAVRDEYGEEVIVEWSSGDEGIVEVDSDGNLKAKGPGTVTITGKDEYGNEVQFDVNVTVPAGPTEEELEEILREKLIDNLFENGFDPEFANEEENILISNDDGRATNYQRVTIVPVYVSPADMAAQNFTPGNQFNGTPDESQSFGQLQLSRFVKDSADLASGAITFSMDYPEVEDYWALGIFSAQVNNEAGTMYYYYLPTVDELLANGGINGYRPVMTITATYTNPDNAEETISRDFNLNVRFYGVVDI